MNSVIVKKQNAVDYVLDNSGTMLIHVCNDAGVMGAGIAKEVKDRLPEAFNKYSSSCRITPREFRLGTITQTDKVINMIAQQSYYGENGTYTKNKSCYLNYGALADCLSQVAHMAEFDQFDSVVLPLGMGAGRAGGDWYIVLSMVEYYLKPVANIIICDYTPS